LMPAPVRKTADRDEASQRATCSMSELTCIANAEENSLDGTKCVRRTYSDVSTWSVAVEVLDRCYVSPGNLVDGDFKHSGNFLALEGTWRPAAQGDRRDAALVEAASAGEFGDIDRLRSTAFGD